MASPKKNREEHRYYLLPGMGASNRRWHRRTQRWAILVGILCSLIIAGLLYLINRR